MYLTLCASKTYALEPSEEQIEAPALRIWADNFHHPATIDFIQLALEKSPSSSLAQLFVGVEANGVEKAVEMVTDGNAMDLLVTGANMKWESQLLPVYFPLERGLLGFRMCLINSQDVPLFESIRNSAGFSGAAVKVGLLEDWPDTQIMRDNQVNVLGFQTLGTLLDGLRENRFQCFSRSVIEVHEDLISYPEFEMESFIGIIYPFADFIYVSPQRPELRDALMDGMLAAWQDGSFKALYVKHYAELLAEYAFYNRKLLIMENASLSVSALDAINLYGIASFTQGGREP